MKKLVRFIEGYDKLEDRLVEEIPIDNIPLHALQTTFGEPDSDPMYECYAIDEFKARHLSIYLDKPLKLDELDYFLVCYSLDNE